MDLSNVAFLVQRAAGCMYCNSESAKVVAGTGSESRFQIRENLAP